MRLPHFVVDAFTRERFRGNSAAVCVLESWPADDTLRAIAAENNLAETAFLVREGDGWSIRWLTPVVEVDLCGHATLAAAHVVLTRLTPEAPRLSFASKSGRLTVERDGARLAMDFPARPTKRTEIDPEIGQAIGATVIEMHRYKEDLVAVVADAETVRDLAPDYGVLRTHPARVLCVTAPAGAAYPDVDFVSRFFAPNEGIDEDPVTGSAHCMLAPLWSGKLGKARMNARQLSARTGELDVELRGDRVILRGHAVLVVEGTMIL